jgi:S-(hydroxymethyl)glutathione dehydrogenase/alcohol dehydrogenase
VDAGGNRTDGTVDPRLTRGRRDVRTHAAILFETHTPWQIEEVELSGPGPEEVLVKMSAAGLCHSDEHVVTGDMPAPLPFVGGHEGAGVVEQVGNRVWDVVPGDHVVMSFIPSCGKCRWCASGRQNLCDLGAYLMRGTPIGGGEPHMRLDGAPVSPMSLIGCFAEHQVLHEASVIKIDPELPLDKAALVSCGVTTGWGSAVYVARAAPGDAVVVVGVGGIGAGAVQGARIAGAKWIIAVDPVEWKRDQAKAFGATHVAADVYAAFALVNDLTRGQLADSAIITTGVAYGDLIAPTMSLVRKGGAVVVTALAPFTQSEVKLSLFELTLFQKELRGALFGGGNPRVDIPKLLSLYKSGQLLLDEMITRTYPLAGINAGYEDMREGRNIRGVLVFD